MYEIALISVGLLAGSLLTEGLVLVPFWRNLPMAQFYKLHESAAPKLFRYFAPLTAFAVLASASLALSDGRLATWIAACFCSMALLIFFLFFRRTNNNLSSQIYGETELATVLKRWARWHHIRTIFVALAFFALALSR